MKLAVTVSRIPEFHNQVLGAIGANENILRRSRRCVLSSRVLENILESKLHDSSAVISSHNAGRICTRGDLAEGPAAEVCIRIAEAQAIGNIEGLGSKFNLVALGDSEFPGHALIPFPKSRTSQAAYSHVPVSASSGERKRGGIEPAHTRTGHTALSAIRCRHIRKDLIRTLRHGNGGLAEAHPVVSLIAADHRH